MTGKSIGKGVVAGLLAAAAMNGFQELWSAASKALAERRGEKQQSSGGDDATVKTANAISQSVWGCELNADQKKWAGPAVHYTLGALLGATYGALADSADVFQVGYGTGYGAGVWLVADETAVPAFGLGPKPTETPISSHVSALAGHLVFGFVTDRISRIGVRD